MIKTFFLTFIIATIITIAATYFYLGGYKEPKIGYGKMPSYHLVYKKQRGPYSQTSFTIDEVEKILNKKNIACERSFGLFLDSPDEIKEQDLRSWAGCAFLNKNQKIENIEGLHYNFLKESKAVVATFGGSPALGPIKVYSKLNEWLNQKKVFPSLEIYSYNQSGDLETTYYFDFKMGEIKP